ncbi:MAG: bifunctional diaminohydroxyphosphoribosylaminopyrimidine deaminase/5-amino-6-(5-phosphoribosylamino)uracil reductase RibD [Bacteriovorax sp.]
MNHEHYMRMAFDLARLGLGHTSPNPLVGAVLVKGNKIIGTGYHQKYGSAHAEVNAILDAKARGESVHGSTLYCNLEPCSHTNKLTPPCAPMIVLEKISCVVISNIDPNPHVNGGGIAHLRDHGVDVVTGILEKEGRELNEVFFKFIKSNSPFIHLKMAQTLDGRVATTTGESKYITGAESRERVHSLRQKYDCIMVGRKTVELDDPSLTTRSDEFEKISHPLRLVVGSLGGLNHDWKILTDEFKRNTMIVATDEDIQDHPEVVRFLESKGVALLSVKKTEEGKVDLKAMLKSLAGLKMTSILVEGGPTLATEFLRFGLVDKVSFFIAPSILGFGVNSINDLGFTNLNQKIELKNRKTEILGNDILVEGYPCSPA